MRFKIDRVAYVICALFVVFLLIFGWKVHVIETQGAEEDGYVGKAQKILSGQIPRDPWHPLLYPILSAAAGAVTGDTFTGARAVTTLFAGLFVFAAYRLGRTCFSKEASLFALVALVLNYNVICGGVEAATDMSFAALVLVTLLLALRVSADARYVPVILLALSFALAFFTRYTALFLVPVVVMALSFSLSRVGAKRRAITVATFVCAVGIVLIPHFILAAKAFGSPFYNENWKNLAWKMYGENDWNYLRRVPYDGPLSVVMSSPMKVVFLCVRELGRFFYVTVGALGGQGLAGALFSATALFGAYKSLLAIDRKRAILITFAATFVFLTCLFFLSLPRLMLSILPLGYLWAGEFLLSGPFSGSFRVAKIRVSRAALVVAVFMIALVASTALHLRMYVAAHPVRELEAARFVERTYGSNVTVFGTCPFMQRSVKYSYRALPVPTGDETSRSKLYFDRLKTLAETTNADFVIVGKLFLENRPVQLLSGVDVPDFLEVVYRTPDAVVYRVVKQQAVRE